MLNQILSPIDRFSFRTKALAVAAAPAVCLVAIAAEAGFGDGFPLWSVLALALVSAAGFGLMWREAEAITQAEDSAAALADGTRFTPVESGSRLGAKINSIHANQEQAKVKQREVIKKGISEIVVNLARRSQSLVDRQVEVLDELEQVEENPERLEKLFTIDHLATRMRRNSESLLVLADGEEPKLRVQPVAISDVMRVAVGEVENYQNLDVQTEADAKVSAAAAVDLAHLLAELIENASHFSPPDKPVEIIGKFNIDQDYVINVIDHGVGMSAPQRELSNDILANPPELDLGLSRSLGFNVIGRLAKRLGMGAAILDTPGSGVSAVVRIPKSLLVAGARKQAAPQESALGQAQQAPQAMQTQAPTETRKAAPAKQPIPQNRDASSDKGAEALGSAPAAKNSAPKVEGKSDKQLQARRKTDPKPTKAPPTKKPVQAPARQTPDALKARPSKAASEKAAPKETLAKPAAAPKKLDEAVPTGDAFNKGVDALLGNDGPAPLTKRKRGEAKIPLGEGRVIPEQSRQTTAKASSRNPEEIRSMLSRYRDGIKGNQETNEGENNE